MGKPLKKTDRNKPWNRKQRTIKQRTNNQIKRKTFLIICEGQNTEPEYFKSFPVATANVKSFGLGASKTALMKQTVILKKQEDDNDLEVWCVFDMDIKYDEVAKQKEDFNQAINIAQENNIQVAYSNDCFELWFVLHFQLVDGQLHRKQYYEILSKYLNTNYVKAGKSRNFSRSIYQLLSEHTEASQIRAIEFARQLHEKCIVNTYADRNPCTTVYQLVCDLNRHVKRVRVGEVCEQGRLE